jgi:hypothetical protein
MNPTVKKGRGVVSYIGELRFDSKSAAQNYTRNIIVSLGYCKVTSTHEHFNFFIDLIKNLSNYKSKIGCGVDYFHIVPNALQKKSYHINLVRKDKTEIDISWKNAASSKWVEPADNLTNAMRVAISPDISKFRSISKIECNECGVMDEGVTFHVDHVSPSFKDLHDNFLKNNKLQLPTQFDDDEFFRAKFKKTDSEFTKKWLTYHRNNCELQILCMPCNCRKGSK